MNSDTNGLVPVPRAPAYAATTWGPYYDTLNPPGMVHWMAVWRGAQGRMDEAARRWRQRQALRAEYEAAHGSDPSKWPTEHPGADVDGLAVCLGCQWIGDTPRVDHHQESR